MDYRNTDYRVLQRRLRMRVQTGLPQTKFRTLRVNVGDRVRVLVGDFINHEGVVQRVFLQNSTIHVQGVINTNSKGVERPRPVHVSNCIIIKINERNSRRL